MAIQMETKKMLVVFAVFALTVAIMGCVSQSNSPAGGSGTTPAGGTTGGTTGAQGGAAKQTLSACGSVKTDAVLSSDISAAGTCFTIDADNIVLDCAGHSITGKGGLQNSGILLQGRKGVTVKNCEVIGFGDGIYLTSTKDSTISGNTALKNEYQGIFVGDSQGNTLTGNNLSHNKYGIMLHVFASNNTISGNTAFNNTNWGIGLDSSSDNNTVKGNTITKNTQGMSMGDAHGNAITGNTISQNSQGIYIDYATGNTITGNTIVENFVPGVEASGYGITLSRVSGSTITKNRYCQNGNGNVILGAEGTDNVVSENGCD